MSSRLPFGASSRYKTPRKLAGAAAGFAVAAAVPQVRRVAVVTAVSAAILRPHMKTGAMRQAVDFILFWPGDAGALAAGMLAHEKPKPAPQAAKPAGEKREAPPPAPAGDMVSMLGTAAVDKVKDAAKWANDTFGYTEGARELGRGARWIFDRVRDKIAPTAEKKTDAAPKPPAWPDEPKK